MAAKGSEIAWVRLRSKADGAWLVHPDLRDLMMRDATEKGTNLTDVAVRILSQFFNVPFEPSTRRSDPTGGQDVLNFGVSPALKSAIVRAYPTKKWTDSIRYVLCRHYGLRVPEKIKRTRARRRTVVA